MERLPLGVARIDSILRGGAPPGSTLLAAGESGAGGREFAQTAAAMNALYDADPDLFDLYYGDLPAESAVPPEVHYVSFTADSDELAREMEHTMDDDIVEAATEEIRFRDLSPEYFQLSPIPREWYMGEAQTIEDLGKAEATDDVLGALGDYLNEHAAGNLVVIDSISDLIGAMGDDMEWSDITTLIRGLTKASHTWDGLIIMIVNRDAITGTEFGQLMDAAEGTFEFTWESGGSQRARTMVVRQFRGVLSQLEAENIVRFETEIHEGGFDVSDVRKIR
ncbi:MULTISPECIES: RAD55 family ATPase [Halolamina]|uniref:RecA-superfamily ATPase, KaiC/GvpD/RAD55 family n=1 Tax=Halolamina pelagica TaxID=699431 RepID=A0A1I5RMP1_9EURY|nr:MULTISPECIES: HTR-like protein [Halolamina]NHX35262.1 HTR-like protein [Halolamina sp. R1-12]SFP59809.1 RecA-superfamily ATPase, KaiC/GvpD/RAD55 family [Halolamina pelagica]